MLKVFAACNIGSPDLEDALNSAWDRGWEPVAFFAAVGGQVPVVFKARYNKHGSPRSPSWADYPVRMK